MYGFQAYTELLSLLKWASLIVLAGLTIIVVSRKVVNYLIAELEGRDKR